MDWQDGRRFLKSDQWRDRESLATPQKAGLAEPPREKAVRSEDTVVALPAVNPDEARIDLAAAVAQRRSCRQYSSAALTVEQLSFALWAVQGKTGETLRHRAVPSGGGRHGFDTYVTVHGVEGMQPGLYRYQVEQHVLVLVTSWDGEELRRAVTDACLGQAFVGQAAACFVWVGVPARVEWRYGPLAHKLMALDAGHICQNLYLAAEALGAKTCAIGAYDQKALDALIGVDGSDELTVYAAPLGFPPSSDG